MLGAIPCAVYCLSVLSEATYYHKLMLESVALIWLIPIILLEHITELPGLFKKGIVSDIMILLLLVIIGNFIVGANISYLRLYTNYEKTYALYVRMEDRIEQLENWKDAEYLYITGKIEQERYVNADMEKSTYFITGIKGGLIAWSPNILNQHVGENYKILTSKGDKEKIIFSQEYLDMPRWPAAGSVKIIGNVAVVKLDEINKVK